MKEIREYLIAILVITLLVLFGPIIVICAFIGKIPTSILNLLFPKQKFKDVELKGWTRFLVGIVGLVIWIAVWAVAYLGLCSAFPGSQFCPETPTPAPTVTPTIVTETPTPTNNPTAMPTVLPTATNTPTHTPLPTPTPCIEATGWETFADELGSWVTLENDGNAITIEYGLVREGYVGISKVIGPGEMLTGTSGLQFSYDAEGASNTFKVILLYEVGTGGIPGESPKFSVSRPIIIGTNNWVKTEYDGWECWKDTHVGWTERCPETINLTDAWRIDIAIANTPGSRPGNGRVTLHNAIECID